MPEMELSQLHGIIFYDQKSMCLLINAMENYVPNVISLCSKLMNGQSKFEAVSDDVVRQAFQFHNGFTSRNLGAQIKVYHTIRRVRSLVSHSCKMPF